MASVIFMDNRHAIHTTCKPLCNNNLKQQHGIIKHILSQYST